jgi:hypothetical protein
VGLLSERWSRACFTNTDHIAGYGADMKIVLCD